MRVTDGGPSVTELLAADTRMGAVTLDVADLDAVLAFYRDGVALEVLAETDASVTLGRGGRAVITLVSSPELKHAGPHAAGLFHTAIVFDSEAALAAAVYSVATKYPTNFTGSADHLVSKAFYFDDPEGNGVELGWDRDRSQWSWVHGFAEMGTQYLDANAFLRTHLTEQAIERPRIGGAAVGHVHLAVGDIPLAEEFYVRRLGFETTAELPGSALFVSAGKYHHHIGLNVWNSRGAGRRAPALGLATIDLAVPSDDELGTVAERMSHFKIATRDDGASLSFEDPWANTIRLARPER